ncbi:MAG TPA: PRC-barrel domain-containing protein [Thermodesulfobacteriota bacterium]|nr:PRC-barrel domain-containing protein [Thermodesulfobacteriota bacterium]
MKKMLVAALAAMSLVAVGTTGHAHMNKGDQQGMYQGGMDQQQSQYQNGMDRQSMNQDFSDKLAQSGSFDVQKLLGQDVKGLDGQRVGTVKDFVIDPNGHIFALVSAQDMTGKTIAVPFEAFSNTTDNALTLNISKDQLTSAPDFQQSLANRNWSQDTYSQFGIQPQWSDQNSQFGTQYQGQSSTGTQDQYGQPSSGMGQGRFGGQDRGSLSGGQDQSQNPQD